MKIDLRAVVKWIKIYKRVDYCHIKVHGQQDAYIVGEPRCNLFTLLALYSCICMEDEYCLDIEIGQILFLIFGGLIVIV